MIKPVFHFRMKAFKLNIPKLTETFQKQMGVVLRNSLREFVRAAYPRIPDGTISDRSTGMARGTLKAIIDEVGGRISIPIVPSVTREADSTYPGGRNIEQGKALAKFRLRYHKYTFGFEFEPTLFHFEYNDNFTGRRKYQSHTAPWNAMEEGQIAFIRYLYEHIFEAVPNLAQFMETINEIKG